MAVPAPVDICNMALQELGCNKIASFHPPDNSVNARACARMYFRVLDNLLREHPWTFAISRFQLPMDTKSPLFGYSYAYPLPAGWRKIIPITNNEQYYFGAPNQANGSMLGRQYSVEGNSILCNYTAPLNVRLVMYVDDTSKFDSAFDLAFSKMLAIEMCEELTQSNTKKQKLEDEMIVVIDKAKFANAIENPSHEPPEDRYTKVRR